jgi:hypothetical protein
MAVAGTRSVCGAGRLWARGDSGRGAAGRRATRDGWAQDAGRHGAAGRRAELSARTAGGISRNFVFASQVKLKIKSV